MTFSQINNDEIRIAVIGLGYVGLPLAVEFSKKYKVIGYDIDRERIKELENKIDRTNELGSETLNDLDNLTLTSKLNDLTDCNIYIITVPTPIDSEKKPDLLPLISASSDVGKLLKSGDIVIYESTVFPGATEEICAPILEQKSNLTYSLVTLPENAKVFYLGYSPERINPGDNRHTLANIKKITSGSTPEVAELIDQLYGSIITAGTHKVESIKVAEAAKVIENVQRDVNIALINELTILFDLLNLDTEAILNAAETKWNFLPFKPGLVGGHCIGVDPYYLTHKAKEIGYNPEIILAGRRINDYMAIYAAERIVRLMNEHCIKLKFSRILILGLTFKENCSDTRNSKVFDLIECFLNLGAFVDVFDPFVSEFKGFKSERVRLIREIKANSYDCIILAVSHAKFLKMGSSKIRHFGKKSHLFFDLKYAFPSSETDGRI